MPSSRLRRSLILLALTACNQPRGSVAAAAVSTPAPSASAAGRPAAVAPGAPGSFPVPARTRVAIVGGGVAGLVAAHELKKRGIAYHLLEASDVYGGRVQTATYGEGLHAEFGLQELWGDNPLLGVARDLGVAIDGDVEEPFSSIILDGKLRPYVQESSSQYFATFLSEDEAATLARWLETTRALREKAEKEGLSAPEVKRIHGYSFAKWVEGQKLPHAVSEFVRLTIECELAADWNTFSSLEGILEFGVFLGGGQPNYHVKGGNSRLIEALAAEAGPSKTLGATVLRVDRDRDGRRSRVHYLKDGQVGVLEAERVIVAVPFFRVHQIAFEPPLSGEKWQGILTLLRGHYTVVHLLLDKKARPLWQIDGESPFPVLSDGVLGVIYGVMEESPPSQDVEVFSLLVHGVAAAGWHMVARDRKLKELYEALDTHWPGLSRYVRAAYVYTYHPASIAVWPPGRSPLDDRSREIRRPELGTYLVGDWTISGHSDGAARSAQAAVADLARGL